MAVYDQYIVCFDNNTWQLSELVDIETAVEDILKDKNTRRDGLGIKAIFSVNCQVNPPTVIQQWPLLEIHPDQPSPLAQAATSTGAQMHKFFVDMKYYATVFHEFKMISNEDLQKLFAMITRSQDMLNGIEELNATRRS